jgi:REP element-mobilizing transposase RayT
MARKPRIEFEGALYHVITRGNQRQRVFKDRDDYERYLKVLETYKNQYDYLLYAYVLMGNHVHLLIETKERPLSKILQGINQSYTIYFNKRYRTVGHLFQGRYKAILCEKDAYLLSLVKYIHLNPIRAGVVKSLEEYPWSSHRCYVRNVKSQGIVDTEQVLRFFSENKGRARRLYQDYMGEGERIKREDVYSTVSQRILGDEEFVKEVLMRTGRSEDLGKRKHEYTLMEIGRAVEGVCGITLRHLREKSKDEGIVFGRRLVCLVAREYGYRGREIAEYLRRDPAVITRYSREMKKFEGEVEKVHVALKKTRVNKQV